MTFSTLELGFKVRRGKFDYCDGLFVHAHDLTSFCIPVEDADRLSETYKQYLVGCGCLDWKDLPQYDEQVFECDKHTIGFFHERDKSAFVAGAFHLGAAIDFVQCESSLPIVIAIRWCMMMEFIFWQDQRLEERQERKKNDAPPVSIGDDSQSGAA